MAAGASLALWLAAQLGGKLLPSYAAVSQAGMVNIAVEPSSKSATVGEIFTLDIRVHAGTQPVDAVDAYLNFSPQVLQVVDSGGNPATAITPGTALRVLHNSVDNSTGRIDFNAGRGTGDQPASGSFVLATIRFKALAVGSSFVAFSLSPPRTTDAFFGGNSVLGSTADGQVAVTATPGGSPTGTPTATATSTSTATPTPTLVGGIGTATPTATATPTLTPTPTATQGPPPAIMGPAAGSIAPDMAPLLSWSNPPGTTQFNVRVEPFNRDGPGIDLLIADAGLVAQASYKIQAPEMGVGNYVMLPGMTYTWSVRTSSAPVALGSDDSQWGAWASSAFRTPPPSSEAIAPVGPQNDVTVDSLTPTLQWSNTDRRIFYYEVQVSKDPTFNTDPATASAMVYWELRHGGVTQPLNSYTIPAAFPLEAATAYQWRVRPRVQGDGSPVEWTNARRFRTP